jgi:prolyl oligopeptidase
MKNYKDQIIIISLFSLMVLSFSFCKKPIPAPPETMRDSVIDILHGDTIIDPYRWLEDQESLETRAWIDKQNKYTQSFLDDIKVRENIKERYTELLRVDRVSLPGQAEDRYFFEKRGADQDLWIICMREGLDGEDQVLIDPHGMSQDHTVSVSIVNISKNGKLLVYGIRKGGEDEIAVRIYNVDEKTELPDSMPRGRYFGISLLPDLSGFYYTKFIDVGARVFFHKMGTDFTDDQLIFGEGYDPGKIIYAGLTEDSKYLMVHVLYGASSDKTDVYIRETGSDKPFTTVVSDINAAFFAEEYNDELYVITNWQAPKNRILRVPVNQLPGNPDSWEEVIPEGEGIIENSSGIASGSLLVISLENVVSRARFFNTDGKLIRELDLPSMGSIGGVSYRQSSNHLFYSFTSFHIPTTSYYYDIDSGEQKTWSELDVPIDQENIEVKQVLYNSGDGTKIPMFLVHEKGLELNGNNPVYLTGYGGFNISETAGFSATAVIFAENGGVFALPNLRGGGEFGEEWHRAGMLEKKQNVFDDFYAAAEWLIENNYTNPEKIAIRGGSNGGLLVGTALTQRPELFRAVVCTYPLLDMIRYHQFLVAKWWVPEYGSADDPEQYKYLIKYSPYQNVKNESYPATLFITGDSDTRVAPLHARKMTALLQYKNEGNTPILLYYDTEAGHSGGSSVTKTIEEATIAMSFIAWQLDMKINSVN